MCIQADTMKSSGLILSAFLPHVPHHVQEQVDAMVSKLRGLTGTADGSIEGYDVFREGVQRDLTATEDLLTKGRKNQQVELVLHHLFL